MKVTAYLLLLTVFLESCASKPYTTIMEGKVTIFGIAKDDKEGAIVITEKGKKYNIDRLDAWDEEFYDKKVKVTGKLVTRKYEKQSTDSVWIQERVGIWYIIKNPKWSLAD